MKRYVGLVSHYVCSIKNYIVSVPWYGLGFAALKSVNRDILKKLQIKTSGKSGNTGDLQTVQENYSINLREIPGE
jgi:hypothetical protein